MGVYTISGSLIYCPQHTRIGWLLNVQLNILYGSFQELLNQLVVDIKLESHQNHCTVLQ